MERIIFYIEAGMPGLQHFVVGLAGRNDHIVSEWELNIPVDSLFEFRNSFSQWFIIRVLLKEWTRPLRRHAKSRSWSAWANRLSDWNIHLRAVNDFLQSTSNNNFYSRVHFRSGSMLRWIWHYRSRDLLRGGQRLLKVSQFGCLCACCMSLRASEHWLNLIIFLLILN